MEHVDVAIVGGGPAGSSAGAAAAAAGADAVVLEKGVPREDREEVGPDSTDAAGFLDYWVEVADVDYREIPDDVVLQELDSAAFVGPTETVELFDTGIDSEYPEFGFTFHRARFDDWLRDEAEDAGAEYRTGVSVRSVDSAKTAGEWTHTLTLAGGDEIDADALVLADGPQRRVTMPTLDQFLEGRSVGDLLGPPHANHIAYQEYRRMPEDAWEPRTIKFWWGWMPGETAYPWVFPNDEPVARVGLTMPIGMDIDAFPDRDAYRLLRPEDDRIPDGGTYIERLLEAAYPEQDLEDFSLVEDRGKHEGTETYPISSTRPIDSPTAANVAIVGGAMGTTSAFHEGGDHCAMRTGKLAGRMAAEGRLEAYNDAWKEAIGAEILRNVSMADVVRDYGPSDWDHTFEVVRKLGAEEGATKVLTLSGGAGLAGIRLAGAYKWRKWQYRDGRYTQLREAEYAL
jgi:electron-transferring-flavoprotein dehydrogenase